VLAVGVAAILLGVSPGKHVAFSVVTIRAGLGLGGSRAAAGRAAEPRTGHRARVAVHTAHFGRRGRAMDLLLRGEKRNPNA
jgi:hypothetical protein